MSSSPTLDPSLAHNAWRCVGLREEYGEIRALPFRSWTEGKVKKFCGSTYVVEWYSIDLYKGEITKSGVKMPDRAGRLSGASVACGNRVYVLGGMCLRDRRIPGHETMPPIHSHAFVFYLDSEKPEIGWEQAKPMLSPSDDPVAVAAGGDIYVFGFEGVDVFRTHLNKWKRLGNTSGMDLDFGSGFNVSDPVLFDSSGPSRILVHFRSAKSLRAYHFDRDRWECVDNNFGFWPHSVAILDDVLYGISFFPVSQTYEKSLKAYDLCKKEWLTVKWLSVIPLRLSMCSKLVYLGKDQWCIIQSKRDASYYIKLKLTVVSVCNRNDDDDDDIRVIQAQAESERCTFVEGPHSYHCEIPNL